MKRILTFFTVFSIVLIAHESSAQKVNVGLNAAASIPLEDNGDLFKAAPGFDGSLDYYFNNVIDVGVEAGFRSFRYDDDAFDGERLNVVPVQATVGVHNDLGDIVDLYGELGGGVFFMSSSFSDESDSYGGLSPRVGLAVELANDWFLDTNLNYTHVFTEGDDFNWLGVKFGLLYTIN